MNFARPTCLFFLAAAVCLAQTTTPVVITRSTGMVGIADSQIARFNLLNPGAVPPATAVGCTAIVSFFDAAGTMLKTSALTIAPRESASLDLHSDTDLMLASGDRTEIRAVFTLPATPGPTATSAAVPACTLVPTLEIFDTVSGRTLVTLGRTRLVP